MTRAPARDPGRTAQPNGAARVAVLHQQGGLWRLLVAEHRMGVSVIESATVTADPAGAVAAAEQRHGFTRIIRLVPGRQTVARAAAIAVAEASEMSAALSLLAEAQLPENIPPHRRAAGLVPDVDRPGSRTALLTGWSGGDGPEFATLHPDIEETWTTEVAALAALRAGVTGCVFFADPSDGALALLASSDEKSSVRVLVEDASSPARFADAVGAVVAETCTSLDLPTPAVALAGAHPILHLAPHDVAALRSSVRAIPDSRTWLPEFGIALGAAMLALSKDPLTRPLAALRATAPVARDPLVRRAADWLGSSRNARTLLVASVALALVGPLAISWGRLAVLDAKAAHLAEREQERADAQRRTAMYQQLEAARWPMTKLLADVAGAVPVGVVASSVRLSTDQGLTIQGTADAAELVNAMQGNLNAMRVFGNVKIGRMESSSSGVEFDLSADVVKPHLLARPREDFAAQPLAVRLYGEGASNTAPPAGSAFASSNGSGRRTTTAPRPSESTPSSSETIRTTPRPAAAPGEPPPPLTDEQIAAMDRRTAMTEWANRRTWPQKNPGLDAATKARLEEEATKLRDQMTKAPAGGTS